MAASTAIEIAKTRRRPGRLSLKLLIPTNDSEAPSKTPSASATMVLDQISIWPEGRLFGDTGSKSGSEFSDGDHLGRVRGRVPVQSHLHRAVLLHGR